MLSRRSCLLLFCTLTLVALDMLFMRPGRAFASPKARLTLNRQQGPLGVTLTLSGDAAVTCATGTVTKEFGLRPRVSKTRAGPAAEKPGCVENQPLMSTMRSVAASA